MTLHKRITTLTFCTLLLCSCASSIMQSYVGKSIQDVMLDYGAPSNAFDMESGQRAFQWSMTNVNQMPTYATTTGYATGVGNMTFLNANTQLSGGGLSVEHCVYTLFAMPEEGNGNSKGKSTTARWTVTGFKAPRLSCE